jgi:hypothetical protein
MAKCAGCGAETCLYVNGTPVCIACADMRRTETPMLKPMTTEETAHAQSGYQLSPQVPPAT